MVANSAITTVQQRLLLEVCKKQIKCKKDRLMDKTLIPGLGDGISRPAL